MSLKLEESDPVAYAFGNLGVSAHRQGAASFTGLTNEFKLTGGGIRLPLCVFKRFVDFRSLSCLPYPLHIGTHPQIYVR